MAIKYLTPIGVLAASSAPSTDLTGSLYYNTSDNKLYTYSGSAWVVVGAGTATTDQYTYTATASQTSVSGPDDNSNTLSYTVGQEQVFLNGNLLVRGSDYTASTGTSITGLSAMASGDIISIYAFGSFNVVSAVNLSSYTAKGTLVVGTSTSAISTLAAGTNGYYLKADSTQATGLVWAPVADDDQTILASQIFG